MIQFQSSDFASLLLLLVANVRKEKKEGEGSFLASKSW
jgi:hypothetical protein